MFSIEAYLPIIGAIAFSVAAYLYLWEMYKNEKFSPSPVTWFTWFATDLVNAPSYVSMLEGQQWGVKAVLPFVALVWTGAIFAASVVRYKRLGGALIVRTPDRVGLAFNGGAMLTGLLLWFAQSGHAAFVTNMAVQGAYAVAYWPTLDGIWQKRYELNANEPLFPWVLGLVAQGSQLWYLSLTHASDAEFVWSAVNFTGNLLVVVLIAVVSFTTRR